MITISGRLICANAIEAELVAQLLPEHARLTRAEPGCLSFHMIPTADPLVWLLDEAFKDREAYEAHRRRARSTPWNSATAHLKRDIRTTGI